MNTKIKTKRICSFCFLLLLFLSVSFNAGSWGFYAHKLINRIAVFSLPNELFGFYKFHIDYLTENSVNADKRRYIDTAEACRHYIDLDHYEKALPLDTMPRTWKEAIARFTEDTLLEYGIVPWHIQVMMFRLTKAMKEKNVERILKNSADLGHYVADAHVPLHATENYNGQLSGQTGIHGFWEGRLPELFAGQYDLFVGRATYIDKLMGKTWETVEGSFAALDSVLGFERKLNHEFAPDKKYSLEQRGQKAIKVYSKEYAEAYHNMLNGQVERRLRASIVMVANLWYTAWVDAGQPDLNTLVQGNAENSNDAERKKQSEEAQKMLGEKMIGREE